ncbi:hypothetical protein TNCV_4690481 [Trichonephila clavipes]|nr:hypothetical protein TNCV_4690481 [Trichonephila clavipes]
MQQPQSKNNRLQQSLACLAFRQPAREDLTLPDVPPLRDSKTISYFRMRNNSFIYLETTVVTASMLKLNKEESNNL